MGSELAVRKVLVVDDNAENRALAQAALDDEGIRAVLASSGDEGIAAFARERPDCILLDIRMPGIDGITACERIRAAPGGSDVAIIFVTAQRDVETFDRALRAGGDDFITKPFRPAELMVRIDTALRLRRIAAERGALASELKHQRDVLQRLQLEKEQLSAFLVHDLKNPVNTIELQVQRVLRNPGDPERARDAAQKIHDETTALMRMITNLLDIGRADEGQLAPVRRSVDARALVGGVIDELRTRAVSSGIELVSEVATPTLEVDPDVFHRVIANLVDNAIRYAPEGSAIKIAVTRSERSVELRVKDAGPGVPPELRQRVFERFVSSSGESERRSHGLGLAFCKVAVEAHGGEIWIEDGHPGAVFCIRMHDA
ncbi:MAG TPA: response regulator [Kofleriaceae bacterium]|nr:response regulator [Kofleriaceae bacterium]